MKLHVVGVVVTAVMSATAALAATVSINVGAGLSFNPNDVTIQVGDTVTWSFLESNHTTTSDLQTGPETWSSGVVQSGGTFSHTFGTAGNYRYYCAIHSFAGGTVMNGIIRVAAPVPPPKTAGDFDGDGKADLVWRGQNDGKVILWLMNGATVASVHPMGSVNTGYRIEAVGDLNNDGHADLVWHNPTTGNVVVWLMDTSGTAVQSVTNVGTVDTDYVIEGAGDFNGDGKTDLIWHGQTSGNVVVWMMNGATVQTVTALGSVDNTYKIEAVGDLNGDGKADLVWRGQRDGNVVVWLTNASGTGIGASTVVGSVNTTYRIVAAADLNGDGRADLIWRGTSDGNVVVWAMNGVSVQAASTLGNVNTTSAIEAVGDCNGDGVADMVWRGQNDGSVVVWLTSTVRISVASSTLVGFVDSRYKLEGPE